MNASQSCVSTQLHTRRYVYFVTIIGYMAWYVFIYFDTVSMPSGLTANEFSNKPIPTVVYKEIDSIDNPPPPAPLSVLGRLGVPA